MTVSLIRTTESHGGTTGSVSEASYTFAVGQAGDAPKGILVFTMQGVSATEAATAVTYGGASLSKVTGGSAADTATEPGRVTAWFLGASVPSGVQNCVVTRTNNTTVQYAVAFLLGGAADTQIAGTPVLQQENAAMTAVTIDPGAGTAIVLAGGYTGDNTPAPAGSTGTTTAHTLLGTYAYSFGAGYETTPTTGSRSRGLAASNDDRAQVVLAVGETAAPRSASGTLKTQFPLLHGTAANAPARSASGSLKTQLPLLHGTAANVPPARSATGSLKAQLPLLGGTATNVILRTGDGSLSLQLPLLGGIATNVPPPRTAAGSLKTQLPLLQGTGTNVPPPRAAAGSLKAQSPLLGGAATNELIRTAAGSLKLQLPLLGGSATNVPPARSASGRVLLQLPLLTGAATNVPPARSASGGLKLQAPLLHGSATNEAPPRTAAGTLKLQLAVFAGTATNEPPARSGSGALVLQLPLLDGSATNTPSGSARTADGALVLGKLRLGGTATKVPASLTLTEIAAGEGDGYVRNQGGAGVPWATVRAATIGTLSVYMTSVDSVRVQRAGTAPNQTYMIDRAYVPFDTSAIPEDDTIRAASLFVYQDAAWSPTTMYVCAASIAGANLMPGDFETLLGDVEFGSFIGAGTLGEYDEIVLNAAGIAYISKSGITEFGVIESYDWTNTEPPATLDVTHKFVGDTPGQSAYLRIVHGELNADFTADIAARTWAGALRQRPYLATVADERPWAAAVAERPWLGAVDDDRPWTANVRREP